MRASPLLAAVIAFCALTLIGIMPTSSGGLSDYQRKRLYFAQEGKGVMAIVTEKLLNDPRVSYRYEVGGRVYSGGAFVSQNEWVRLKVGGPVNVLYDPKDPSQSDHRPESWLKGQDDVRRIGRWIALSGIVGLVACAVFAIGSRYGCFGPGSILGRIVTVPCVVGAIFFLVALGMQVGILSQYLGGGMVTRFNDGPPHVASGWDVLGMSVFLVPFWGIGLALIIFGASRRL